MYNIKSFGGVLQVHSLPKFAVMLSANVCIISKFRKLRAKILKFTQSKCNKKLDCGGVVNNFFH